MFIGHYAVAFAGKRVAPSVSLGTLVLAAQFVDLLYPLFLLLGIEHVRIAPGFTAVAPLDFFDYPWSHSLLAVLAWSAAFGCAYYILRRSKRGAWTTGIVAALHWIMDFISHGPDLQLAPGISRRVGLGLWKSVTATAVFETALFVAAFILYLRSTRALDRWGVISLWSLAAALLAIYAASLLGPPPPNVTVLAISSLAQWLFVAWAYWIERHRQPVLA
jgi:hypothetical protein